MAQSTTQRGVTTGLENPTLRLLSLRTLPPASAAATVCVTRVVSVFSIMPPPSRTRAARSSGPRRRPVAGSDTCM